ncbi:unnamed protein product [Rotaria socialis]|uniref:ADP ribosyltransferase domain-containing protein n=1 Tax=Rotaria socialis TaxID=392032 RepID=A0A818KXN9_9BILA|nr:unnamed protein product [Rotaria socialis]
MAPIFPLDFITHENNGSAGQQAVHYLVVETWLLQLAKEQQQIFYRLISNLFNKALECLNETKEKIGDLQKRHAWYHSGIYQLRQLKSDLESIQSQYDKSIRDILYEIERQKEHAKEILLNALKHLEVGVNTERFKHHLNQLINDVDKLVNTVSNASIPAILLVIFSFLSTSLSTIGGAIAAMQSSSIAAGASAFGVGLLVTSAVGGVASEVMFRKKISDFISKMAEQIEVIEYEQIKRLQMLHYYFKGFEEKLCNDKNNNLATNIVWYDKQIKSRTNQYHVNKLTEEFLPENYAVIQMETKDELIDSIISDTEHNIILITSGSGGQEIISEIGSYWNIKGIMIFCGKVDYHQEWASKYKKVLLVTDKFDKVIQEIKNIQSGEIYFLNRGFSLDDITLKLQNVNYYLSATNNGFIITDFSVIESNIDYHINIMHKIHNSLVSKNIYSNGIPKHFAIENLLKCAEMFVEALTKTDPEKNIIYLYTLEKPYYYKIINDILNLLDEELLSLAGDYIKALRYALLKYSDTSHKLPNTENVKLYRGLCLSDDKDFQELLRKFKQSDIIIFPAFLSTSLNRDKATQFTDGKGVLLEISADCTLLNKPKCISAISHHQNEDEVLINCFSLLKVDNIKKLEDTLMLYECTLELS